MPDFHYEAYRVRKNFQWDGWVYAPEGVCECSKTVTSDYDINNVDAKTGAKKKVMQGACGERCTNRVGTDCYCHDSSCHCDCGIKSDQYGGSVWVVGEGHPRKDMMLANRFATYDASLPDIDTLIKREDIAPLLETYVPNKAPKRGRPVKAIA